MNETDTYNVDKLPFTADEVQTVADPSSSQFKVSKPKRDSIVRHTYTHYKYISAYRKVQK